MYSSKPFCRRAGALLIWCLLPWLAGCALAAPASSYTLAPSDTLHRFQGVRLLGALRLQSVEVNGLPLVGLSGLAWDQDEGLLYAISDFGRLFQLLPVFRDGQLVDVRIVDGYPLTDSRGRPLRYPWSDAEGLTLRNGANGIRGDSELLVSFERRPRVRVYTPRGRRLGSEPMPARLDDAGNYSDPNRALESITLHPRWGLLLAPELPLRGDRVSALFAQSGRRWRYPLSAAPGSALVALEALPDGSLLALERAFVSRYLPFTISLRRVQLPADGDIASVNDVAVFNTGQGWHLDNFEGLARHRDRRFFMVSDDNDSIWQNTLLVYFEWLSP